MMHEHYSSRFIVGMILLIINSPLGLGGLACGAFLAKKTCNKFYLKIGSGIYIVSWLMLPAGIWLAGKQGIDIMKGINLHYPWLKFMTPAVICGIIIYAIINRRKKILPKDSLSQPS